MVNSRRYRSFQRYPAAPEDVSNPVQLQDFIFSLVNALDSQDKNIPELPISQTPFIVSVSVESYAVSNGSTLASLSAVVGTLLLKLKDAGIIK